MTLDGRQWNISVVDKLEANAEFNKLLQNSVVCSLKNDIFTAKESYTQLFGSRTVRLLYKNNLGFRQEVYHTLTL